MKYFKNVWCNKWTFPRSQNYNPWYSAGTARSTAMAAWRGSTVTATVSTDMDKPDTGTVDIRNKILEYHLYCFNLAKCVKTTYNNTCINIDSTCDWTPEASCIVFVCLADVEREQIAVPLLPWCRLCLYIPRPRAVKLTLVGGGWWPGLGVGFGHDNGSQEVREPVKKKSAENSTLHQSHLNFTHLISYSLQYFS